MAENIYEISLLGMDLQRAYLEAASKNIANANRLTSSASEVQPEFVVNVKGDFSNATIEFHQLGNKVKTLYQPESPLADKAGFVYKADINLVEQMLMLNKASRYYEANIKAFNSYKEMSASALQIGK